MSADLPQQHLLKDIMDSVGLGYMKSFSGPVPNKISLEVVLSPLETSGRGIRIGNGGNGPEKIVRGIGKGLGHSSQEKVNVVSSDTSEVGESSNSCYGKHRVSEISRRKEWGKKALLGERSSREINV